MHSLVQITSGWKGGGGLGGSAGGGLGGGGGGDGGDGDGFVGGVASLDHLPHWDAVKRVYPERYFHGADRAGNPVMITLQPFIRNLPGLMASVSPEDYVEYRLARLINRQLLTHRLSRAARRVVKMTYVWDLAGFTIKNYKRLQTKPAQAFFGGFDEDAKHAFPEVVAKIVCVNVPWFLHILWVGVRAVLPKRTLAKVVVCKAGAANYAKHLYPVIAPEVWSDRSTVSACPAVVISPCPTAAKVPERALMPNSPMATFVKL